MTDTTKPREGCGYPYCGGNAPECGTCTTAHPKPPQAAQPEAEREAPIDMLLHCPECGMRHIDRPEPYLGDYLPEPAYESEWSNPPHRSHLCHGCAHIWRPADVPTNGVERLKTRGKNDTSSALAAPEQPEAQELPDLPDMVIVGYGADPEGSTWDVEAFTADQMHAYARAAIAQERERETPAARDVLAERQRQVSVEGWTPEHDATHPPEELAAAAAAYGLTCWSDAPPDFWPWSADSFKPKGLRRDWVRGAALYIAAIESLDRAALKADSQGGEA